MKVSNRALWKFAAMAGVAMAAVLCAAIIRMDAGPRKSARAEANRALADDGYISGTVTSAKGPEAGVWVIAQTSDLGTKFRKIVVTNDEGKYVLPDLPRANYKVWVRGYGLVDSEPGEATPGKTLPLAAVVAPSARAAAEFYPADYWASLLAIPRKSDFPMTVPPPPPLPGAPDPVKLTHGTGPVAPPTVLRTQADFLLYFKGCWTCHQMGLKSTREIPASLGTFPSSSKAWERFMSSSQVGREMMREIDRMGHDRTIGMYADWGDRIAKGELPPVPPRPQGMERNVVLTVWDWSVRSSFLHALISTDKRNPSVNANGPVYGADWSAGILAVIDPVKNTSSMIHVPYPNPEELSKQVTWSPQNQLAPSLYFGDELVWNDPINPGPITMDGRGRVWFNVETRLDNPGYCKAGSGNPYAKNSPRDAGGKGVDVYDPETRKWEFVDLCFKSTRIMFSDDKDQTLYFSVSSDPGGIGWVNTRLWDETHDAEKSQGWCPAAAGVKKPGAYGIAYNTVDGSVWYSDIQTMPGRLIRMSRGANPPATCGTEVYEVPYDPKGNGEGGSHSRGIGVDSNGVLWTPLADEGYLASFDRRKCKAIPTGEAAISGKACREGWTFYPIPGPVFKSDPTVKADYNYYMWVDELNTLGLGKNVVIVDGANSDSLIAFQQDTKKWTRLTVPYPHGFFSRFFDGRVDDPKAGWKGHGLWAGNETRGTQLTEGGGNMPSQLAHFQMRPDPLAK